MKPLKRKRRRTIREYHDWLMTRCPWCGEASFWATDGSNLYCGKCGY